MQLYSGSVFLQGNIFCFGFKFKILKYLLGQLFYIKGLHIQNEAT